MMKLQKQQRIILEEVFVFAFKVLDRFDETDFEQEYPAALCVVFRQSCDGERRGRFSSRFPLVKIRYTVKPNNRFALKNRSKINVLEHFLVDKSTSTTAKTKGV
jgi:hypothetical protein